MLESIRFRPPWWKLFDKKRLSQGKHKKGIVDNQLITVEGNDHDENKVLNNDIVSLFVGKIILLSFAI